MALVVVALAVTPFAMPYCTNSGCHDNTGWMIALWLTGIVGIALTVVIPTTQSMLVRLADAIVGQVSSADVELEAVRTPGGPYLWVEERSWHIPISEAQYRALGDGRKLRCRVYLARWSGRVLGAEPVVPPPVASKGQSVKRSLLT